MENQSIKLTIIIPTFNMEKVINFTLNSLEKQTNQDFEVLIIDDVSTDNTKDVVKPYLERNKNWHFLVKEDKTHVTGSINYALQNNFIKGQYVTILDADDNFLPEMVAVNLQKFAEDDEIDIIANSFYHWTPERGSFRRIHIAPFKSRYISKYEAMSPASNPLGKFYRVNLFKTLPKLREYVFDQDLYWWTYLVKRARKIYYSNKPLANYWFRRENASFDRYSTPEGALPLLHFSFNNLKIIQELDPENHSIRAISLFILWTHRKELKKYSKIWPKNEWPKLTMSTKKMKMEWLPWYVYKFLPVNTYFKLAMHKWLVNKD